MLVGTNTKMNLNSTETAGYCDALRGVVAGVGDCELFLLPPFTSIAAARDHLTGSNIAWGAQDVHHRDGGAYTGEISASMLTDLGCRYVAVGHSERRRQRGETDELVATKTMQVLRYGMSPVICVGEPSIGPTADAAAFVTRQLTITLEDVGPEALDRVIIAYEPEWAIGVGARPADPDHVDGVHGAILEVLEAKGGGRGRGRVIYGGSVDMASAHALLERSSVAGLFVGRFALDPTAFGEVIELVDSVARARATSQGPDVRPGGRNEAAVS
jgi:triosephosphate isomerase